MSFTTWAALCLCVFVSSCLANTAPTIDGSQIVLDQDLDPKVVHVLHELGQSFVTDGVKFDAYLVEFDRRVGALGSESLEDDAATGGAVANGKKVQVVTKEALTGTPNHFTPDLSSIVGDLRGRQYNVFIEYFDSSSNPITCGNCNSFPFGINRDGALDFGATDALYPSTALDFTFTKGTDDLMASQEIGKSIEDTVQLELLLVKDDLPEFHLYSEDHVFQADSEVILAKTDISTLLVSGTQKWEKSLDLNLFSNVAAGVEMHILVKYYGAGDKELECAFGCRSPTFRFLPASPTNPNPNGNLVAIEIEDADFEYAVEEVAAIDANYDYEAATRGLASSVEPTISSANNVLTVSHDAGEVARTAAAGDKEGADKTLYEVEMDLYVNGFFYQTYFVSWRSQTTVFEIPVEDLPVSDGADLLVTAEFFYLNLATDVYIECANCESAEASVTPSKIVDEAEADKAIGEFESDIFSQAFFCDAARAVIALQLSIAKLQEQLDKLLNVDFEKVMTSEKKAGVYGGTAADMFDKEIENNIVPKEEKIGEVISAQNKVYEKKTVLKITSIKVMARMIAISIVTFEQTVIQSKKMGIQTTAAGLVAYEKNVQDALKAFAKSPGDNIFPATTKLAKDGASTSITNAEICVDKGAVGVKCSSFANNNNWLKGTKFNGPFRVGTPALANDALKRVVVLRRETSTDQEFFKDKQTEKLGESITVISVGAGNVILPAQTGSKFEIALKSGNTKDVCKVRTEEKFVLNSLVNYVALAGSVQGKSFTAAGAETPSANHIICKFDSVNPGRWVASVVPLSAVENKDNNGDTQTSSGTTTTKSNNLNNSNASRAVSSDDSGISAGGIVGIVAGASVALIIVLGLVAYLIFAKSGSSAAGAGAVAGGYEAAGADYGMEKNPYMVPNPTPVGAMQV